MSSLPLLRMPKPSHWNQLPLYKKVGIYQRFLGKFHAQFVDKLRVKSIVKKICGDDIQVAKVVRVLSSPQDLQRRDLDPSYMIKSAHASKWNINLLPGKKYELHTLKAQLEKWNQLYNPHEEHQYAYLQPRFFIEEKIHDKYFGKSGEAIVYMCRCIYGKVVSISVKYRELRNDYDTSWNIIGDHQMIFLERPKHLERMIKISERLSSLFEFVRMDFYIDCMDEIYLSEYTFSPMGGIQVLSDELEKSLGELWI